MAIGVVGDTLERVLDTGEDPEKGAGYGTADQGPGKGTGPPDTPIDYLTFVGVHRRRGGTELILGFSSLVRYIAIPLDEHPGSAGQEVNKYLNEGAKRVMVGGGKEGTEIAKEP